jgi:hypothetical protein
VWTAVILAENWPFSGSIRRRAGGIASCSHFAPWKISFSGARFTVAPAVGGLPIRGEPTVQPRGCRYADSVLIAAGDRNTCEADLELSRITTLKVAATQPH